LQLKEDFDTIVALEGLVVRPSDEYRVCQFFSTI
jgi:hypothetical protein